jgi:hypothetical protein
MVRDPVPGQGSTVAPLWPRPWLVSRRSGRRSAGDLHRPDGSAKSAHAAGTLLRPRLPESRAELSAQSLAPDYPRIRVVALVRGLAR